MVFLGADTSHIVRRLHRILHGVTHLHHALWNLFQNTQQRLNSLRIDDGLLAFALFDGTVHVGIVVAIFFLQPLVHLLLLLLDKFGTFAGKDSDNDFCRGGYRGVGLTDMDASHIEVIIVVNGSQDGPCWNHGTAAPLVNVYARMSSQSTLKTDAVPATLAARSFLAGYGDAVQLQAGSSCSGSDGVVVL